jgi:hypothetical protein
MWPRTSRGCRRYSTGCWRVRAAPSSSVPHSLLPTPCACLTPCLVLSCPTIGFNFISSHFVTCPLLFKFSSRLFSFDFVGMLCRVLSCHVWSCLVLSCHVPLCAVRYAPVALRFRTYDPDGAHSLRGAALAYVRALADHPVVQVGHLCPNQSCYAHDHRPFSHTD